MQNKQKFEGILFFDNANEQEGDIKSGLTFRVISSACLFDRFPICRPRDKIPAADQPPTASKLSGALIFLRQNEFA
jgi:hypothetical protein